MIENLTKPGRIPPDDGDKIRITNGDAIVEKTHHHAIPVESPITSHVTVGDFWNSWSNEELGRLVSLSESNDAIKGWLFRISRKQSNELVDLSDYESMIEQFVTRGVLSRNRATKLSDCWVN